MTYLLFSGKNVFLYHFLRIRTRQSSFRNLGRLLFAVIWWKIVIYCYLVENVFLYHFLRIRTRQSYFRNLGAAEREEHWSIEDRQGQLFQEFHKRGIRSVETSGKI